MIKIDNNLLESVLNEARANPRKRKHYNFHKSYKEPVQRLLNACTQETYFRVHNHSDSGKIEILLVLKGSLLVVIFDDDGNINDHHLMTTQNGVDGVELLPHEWHSIIILEQDTILYELKEGPFDENKAKVYAPWAPKENTPEAQQFVSHILHELGYSKKG